MAQEDVKLTLTNMDILMYNKPTMTVTNQSNNASGGNGGQQGAGGSVSGATPSGVNKPSQPSNVPPQRMIPPHLKRKQLVSSVVIQDDVSTDDSSSNNNSNLSPMTIHPPQSSPSSAPSSTSSSTSSSSQRKRSIRPKINVPFNFLLKNVYDHSEENLIKKSTDPLLFHGTQLKRIVHFNYKQALDKARMSRIYTSWSSQILEQQQENNHHNMNPKEFHLMKNASRLLHSSRVPLFLNPLQQRLLQDRNVIHRNSKTIKSYHSVISPEISLYRKVFDSYMGEYVNYIVNSLRVTGYCVSSDDEEQKRGPTPNAPQRSNPPPTPQHALSSRTSQKPMIEMDGEVISLPSTTVYFHKAMTGGMLFLELGLDKIYSFLNVYISDLSDDLRANRTSGGDDSNKRGLFLDQAARFKEDLHMSSFSYDFHVRTIHNYLTNPLAEYPSTVDLLRVTHSLLQFYDHHVPTYARNPLLSSSVELEYDCVVELDASSELFEYACLNATTYGVNTIDRAKSCLVLSTYRAVPPKSVQEEEEEVQEEEEVTDINKIQDEKPFVYSHSVYAALSKDSTSAKLKVDLFVACVNTRKLEPYASSEGDKEKMVMSPAKQLQLEMTIKLTDILQRAMADHKLDTLWNSALEFTKKNHMNEHELDELIRLWYSIPISDLDKSLESCFNSTFIPWGDVISQLWPIYGHEYAGCVFRKDGSMQHFLIKCHNDPHVLLHVEYKTFENSVKVCLCKKREQGPKKLSQEECQFVSRFVNHVCSLLWTFAITDVKAKPQTNVT
ncbi:hypothetical protein AKO1_008856 [Acrasis kona]|uniref:Uncharacterized protein n=1 Tax=Acrasis kona TaxID=1008807 RepID=A0AAW2ZDK5_9EUKA